MKIRVTRRPLAGAAATLAAVGMAVAAGGVSARAATAGWRITEVFGAKQQYPHIQVLAADSAKDAWLAGEGGNGPLPLLAEHWNGSTWQTLPVPAGFGANVNAGPTAASSPTDMWTFPTVSGTSTVTQYGLRWNGKSWSKYTFKNEWTLATAVFGGTNAWMFGDAVSKTPVLGFGPPVAARYNGHGWKSVPVPGVVTSLSPLSASDMWAAGPSAKTAGDSGAKVSFLAMHWNGTAWKSVAIPKVAAVDGHAWSVTGIVATSASDVWVKESVDGSLSGAGVTPAGTALLHWTGKKWTTTKNMSYDFYSFASDGHGGCWLSGVKKGSSVTRGYIAHYTGGHWSYQAAPAKSGYTDSGATMVSIPGTKSLWGLASLTPVGQGIDESALLKFGP